MSRRKWLEPPRHLLILFLATALLLSGTLLWFGWQLARQDRELAEKRLRERLEAAADLCVAALQQALSQAEGRLADLIRFFPQDRARAAAALAGALPEDSALALFADETASVYPEHRVPFSLASSAAPVPPEPLFAEAERLEIRVADFRAALAALAPLSRSAQPALRAEALLRIARIRRQQKAWDEALAAYRQLAALGNTIVTGLPADNRETLASEGKRRQLLIVGLAAIAVLFVAGICLIGRAVTRELAVGRLQSEFVSAVSHEFRTPLSSICLLTELLESGRVAADEDRTEYYGVLAREGRRLRRLVDGLLNFGRMEAGAMEYRFDVVDPVQLATEVSREFERSAETAGCHIGVSAAGDVPLVRADRAALESVLWNLLDNAAKYSPECRAIRVDVEKLDGRCAIRVSDRGIGIPEAEQKRIFDKFVRGAAARQSGIPGTGTGLAIVRHIVAAHGGDVRLESAAGRGSTFTVTLPAAE